MKKISILLFTFTLTIMSCNRNFFCTKRGCPCPELIITIEANVDNNMDGSYTEQEIDDFYLIRTDESFETIDSVKLEFDTIGGMVDYNRFYRIYQNTFSDFKNFRSYNLLVKNMIVNSIDTITTIEYTETMKNVLCNTCTYCDDEYVDCMQYLEFNLVFNSTLQDDFNIRIKK